MSQPPLRIAVVGAGLIGRQHIRRVRDEPATPLAAIVDPSPAAREHASAHDVPWFEDLNALLEADRPDGAIVVGPAALDNGGGRAVA